MIKNIVFDLGNVILYDKPSSVLKNIQIDNENLKMIESKFFGNFKNLDLGYITLEEHLDNCSFNFLDENLKELLLHYYKYRQYNTEIVDLMNTLKINGYRIYILSNNNKEVYDYLKSLPMFSCVDGWIMSCNFHIMKPNEEIYQKLIDVYKLNFNECFFIDDSSINLEVAKKLGMQGHILNYENDGIKDLILKLKKNNIEC